MVSDRALQVLRVIVQDYIDSEEPVASKSIAGRQGFGVSAATIRNDMALLEEENLISAPHTSAGRVPTDKGYRVFVDQLARLKPVSPAQLRAIEDFLSESADLEQTLARTVRLLSQLTNQVAILQYPSLKVATVRHLELLPLSSHRLMIVLITDGGSVDQNILETPNRLVEGAVAEVRANLNSQLIGVALDKLPGVVADIAEQASAKHRELVSEVLEALRLAAEGHQTDRLMISGAANLVRGERDFKSSVYPVLEAIEQQVMLLNLFTEMRWESREVQARIGQENEEPLSETSVLASAYQSGSDSSATLGVVGPTRMDYSGNMTAIRAVASYLSRLLGQEELKKA